MGAEQTTLARLEAVARHVTFGVERRGDTTVRGITEDSRQVRPGWLFVAIRGGNRDGHDLAVEAARRGAAALVVQHHLGVGIPQLKVGSTRAVLGPLAAAVHGYPSRDLSLAGVTGTNGKTTVSYLLAAACTAGGRETGLIGTVETRSRGRSTPSTLTTPPAVDLQRTLVAMRRDGVDTVVMEVSSHALDQHRVAGCRFALSAFTNLEPEHLDYHGTIEQYYASKAELFDPSLSERAVICVDGGWGRRLAAQARLPALTFSDDGAGDVRYRARSLGLEGLEVDVLHEGGPVRLRSRLVGLHNAPNVVCAYLAAVTLGVDPAGAARGIAGCERPPGRFEVVDAGQPFLVAVDYAHTPHALQLTLAAARRLVTGRVLLVVGARGGRDRYKRPDTARVAALADWTVITTDNPGDENPALIVEQLRAGLVGLPAANVSFEPDRGAAIAMAIAEAGAHDAVLIAGRGHETTVRFGDLVVVLDDRQAALSNLRTAGYGGTATRRPWTAARP